nr:acyl carrier protein [uncultured Dethiosulfovibrio sp.]
MELSKKINLISEALDTDVELAPETLLGSIDEWDSMGTIAVIAMLDRHFDVRLTAEQLAEVKSVSDILAFMSEKE